MPYNFSQLSKKIISYALPMCSANLLGILSNFIAMFFVARLGSNALAAGALALTTFITIFTLASGTLFSVSIVVSHARGAQHNADVGKIARNAVWLEIILSCFFMPILWHMNTALIWFKQDPTIVAQTVSYFHYAALGMIPTLFGMVVGQFYTGIGRPNFSLAVTALRLPFIVLLSYIFILGRWGVPQCGLGGFTIANLIVQSVFAILMLYYLYKSPSIKRYDLFNPTQLLDKKILAQLFKIGYPIGLQFGGEIAAMSVATYLMGFFGAIVLAATQVASQFSLFVVMLTLGLSQASSVLISHAFAQEDYALIKDYIKTGNYLISICFSVVLIIFIFFPYLLLKWYLQPQEYQNSELLFYAHAFLIISGVVLYIDGIRNMLSGALRGLHSSQIPMRIGVACLWFISLPLSYIVAFPLHGGVIGLRIAFGSGFLVAVIWLWWLLQVKLQTKPV